MKQLKKILKFIIILLVVFLLLYLGLMAYTYIQIQKGNLVKWDGQWFTKEQLQEKYGPQVYEVEAKNTPEEVYASFRQALLDNDIEKALSYITEESREKYREAFQDIKKTNKNLTSLAEMYPEIITKSHEYENLASYNFSFIKNQEKIDSSIEFIKNRQGYWEIDQI